MADGWGDGHLRYDYAWKTPGWTVQNPTFTQVADGYVESGLPDDVAKVNLVGEFLDFESGRPLEGFLTIRTSDRLTYTTTRVPVMPGVKKIRFNQGGFSIWLPATDDVHLTPEFLYQARLTVAGQKMEFQFSLPADTPLVNVLDLLPPQTGSIGIFDSNASGDLELGAVPKKLVLNLTTGADFLTVLTSDTDWDDGVAVILEVGGLTWTATVTGNEATFDVDKAVADNVLDGASASLVVREGSDDQVWAVGRVVRHGGTQ